MTARCSWSSWTRSGLRLFIGREFALLTLAEKPASGSQPKDTSTFAWPASVSADNRRFLDQKGNVYLLKTMSSWAMAQNCTNAEITNALEGLKSLGFNAVTVSPFGVHMEQRQLWRQVQEQGWATFLCRGTLCFVVRPGVVFDGLDHVRSHQAPIDRRVFIVHELGKYRHHFGFGQCRDDERLQLWKNGGNPLCRLPERVVWQWDG